MGEETWRARAEHNEVATGDPRWEGGEEVEVEVYEDGEGGGGGGPEGAGRSLSRSESPCS